MMNGAQQLALTASFHPHWDRDLIARLAREWEVPLDRRIAVLSGGERQKLATLMALGHRPRAAGDGRARLGLDPVARRQFMQTVLEIASDPGRTIFYSSHIVSDIERVASQVWILREGRIIWRGELDALKESVVRLQLRADHDLPPHGAARATHLRGDWAHGDDHAGRLAAVATGPTGTAHRQPHRGRDAWPGGDLPRGARMKTFVRAAGRGVLDAAGAALADRAGRGRDRRGTVRERFLQHALQPAWLHVAAGFMGAALMLFTPLVAGGALFRILSTPRAILLLPHARWRLLSGHVRRGHVGDADVDIRLLGRIPARASAVAARCGRLC